MSSARHQFSNSRSESVSEPASALRSDYVRYVASLLLLAGIYFAAAKLGLSLASVHTNVSPVWPPTGIALAAVLVLGYRMWPGIFLGAFLANFLTPVPIASAGVIAVGNTLEALIAAYALNAVGFRKSLSQARDVLKFVIAATFCTMVAATIGTLSLGLGHAARWSDFGSLWTTWWLGDLTGALTVTPLLLTWSAGDGHWLPKRRYLEAAALVVLLSLAAIVTFGRSSPAPVHYYPLTLLIVPFLLWAAFRLGRRGVTVAVVVISAFAIWGTSHGLGPFSGGSANESLLMLHLFIATNAVTFLFLVTVVEERRLAEATRRENERLLQANLAVTKILAESPETSDALSRILPTVGKSLNWEAGCVWMPDADGKVLRCLAFWQAAAQAPRFEAISRERTFAKGIGLPGRTWETRAPAWIPDVARDDNFLRAPVAAAEGLHGAFAFPIVFSDRFLGVIEFFSREIREPDHALLEMFEGIGRQIGQFVERKRAEGVLDETSDALRLNEERLQLATQTGKVGIWDWNVLVNRVSWTDSLYSIFGVTKEQFDGTVEGFAALVHPDDRSAVSNALDKSLNTAEPYQLEMRALKPGGDVVHLYTNAIVVRAEGKSVRMVGATLDITDLKRAEERLHHTASIVESTDDAIISKDLNGVIASWNAGAEKLYGYKAEEVIGKLISILIPDDRPDEEPAILEKLRRGERIDHYETVRVAKDGRRIFVSLTVSPIKNADGKIIGASKIARDITDQKKTRDEIARLLGAERAARHEAEVASRTKDEFLAVLSHELRTPLTAMLGWLSILRGHKLDKKTTEHALQTIERNAKAQAQLIEDLVDVSRIVGGKLNLQVDPIELLPVIDEAIEVVRPAANAKNIEIDINYDPSVGPVLGDAARLQQVIWNLLSNAVKFTPKGGAVHIDFRRAGSSAEILIRDNGIGIAADFLPHVFERFRQAESPVIRSQRGMGLGLAIVRHLIELHGGTVKAESEGENRGAEFTIRIPLAATTGSSLTAAVSRQLDSNGDSLSGVRILLVEDEQDARELIALVLQGSGAQVEAVDTVGDALQRLPLFMPDVLLSDIGLPLESGYDLIRQVRSLSSEINKVPAIALTAFATESDRKMSLSAGFQAHLAKPVEPSELVKTIKGLINGKS